MDTQLLTTFITLSESGSFSAAAKHLHITQPAVSKRISQLEQQLSVRLFDRLNRELVLTEAGHRLLPEAYQLIEQLQKLTQAMVDTDSTIDGTLTMVVSHYIGLHKLPDLLKAFTERYPDVTLKLTFIDSESAPSALKRYDNELALVTVGSTLTQQHTELEATILWQESLVFVVAKQHALAHQNEVVLNDLANITAILPDSSTYTSTLIKQRFEQAGLFLDIAMATNHFDAIKMMVSLGLGWSVLPESMVDDSLTIIDTQTLNINRNLGLVYNNKRRLSRTARAFIETIKNNLTVSNIETKHS